MDISIEALKDIILEAGELALRAKNLGIDVFYKKDKSPVTSGDKALSTFIYEEITKISDKQVICEERDNLPLKDRQNFWLIDPIDGTRSYIRGENTYTVNIALIKDGIPSIGLIYQPENKKLYYTDSKGKLSIEQNGKKIELPTIHDKESFTAVIGSHYLSKITQHFLKNHFIDKVITVPSSIKLCLIAEGTADIYPRFGQTMEWDTAAGQALILARGGDIVDMEGNSLTYAKEGFENPHFFAVSQNWIKRLPTAL
jgi:3'(2'), 5'-bisphosphate nucleotidase